MRFDLPDRGVGFRLLLFGAISGSCAPVADAPAPVAAAPDVADDAGPAAPAPSCAELLGEVEGGPAAPGLEDYHAALPAILLQTRVTPVLYLERPAETAEPAARKLLEGLERSRAPRRELRRLSRRLRENKPLFREVVLRDGYLFAETPLLARALVAELTLADLFDEDLIHIHGAGGRRMLRREGEAYLDEGGNAETLLLNDRLSLDEDGLKRPLHLDLTRVLSGTGARLARPRAVGRERAAVRLFHPGGTNAEALLELAGGDAEVRCIDAPAKNPTEIAAMIEGFWRWIDDLAEAARLMVRDRPRFDEPRDEPEGAQEDGELRRFWRNAYQKGERNYRYREEEYPVFSRRGYPVPPQVCIDFIFDTFERAAGTWYEKRGRRPRRRVGSLDFSSKDGLLRRQTRSVLDYAADEGTPLFRHDIPAREQAPFERQRRFAAMVAAHGEHIQQGDVLVIHGIREQTMQEHYHAALVLETDALTGMPTVLADNAGWPRIRNLAAVMASAPRRTVKHRLRLDLQWLLDRRDEPWQAD